MALARSGGRRRSRERCRNSVTGSGTPLSSWLPRSSATNRPATWRCTRAVTTTAPGSASACTRAAMFGDVAENLARRIDHHRAGFDADAGGELWLAGAGVLAVEFGERALDRERRPHRALGIVLLRHRIAEQRHQPVAELLGDMAAHLGDRRRGGIEIGADQVAPFLGIELRGNAGRADQIAEHHREMAALASSFRRRHESRGMCRRKRGCRLAEVSDFAQ